MTASSTVKGLKIVKRIKRPEYLQHLQRKKARIAELNGYIGYAFTGGCFVGAIMGAALASAVYIWS